MDQLCEEWSRLVNIPIIEIVPSRESLNDYTIIFNLIDPEEMIDYVLRKHTREDFRDWMPCQVRLVGTILRCRYININSKTSAYTHSLYMNVGMFEKGFAGKLQEFDGQNEISCVNVKIP